MWRALDLFSGIGGWSLAAHRKGIETVAACEIDDWKWRQYSRHFPNVKRYRDVSDLTGSQVLQDVGPIDIVVGSPPCTDISTANHAGKGVDGDESRLYFEAIRLVREIRPRWCAFENSDNLRSRGADRVLAALEAEGYACWPCVVGAVHAGAPHRRLRSWLIAANADSTGLREQPGRRGGPSWQGEAKSPADDRQLPSNSKILGRGKRRTRRFGASSARQQSEQQPRRAEDAADANGIKRGAGRREGDGNRNEPTWRSPITSPAAHADRQRQHGISEHEEVVGWSEHAGSLVADRTGGGGNDADSDSEGLEIGQVLGRYDEKELAAIERGFGLDWNDGPGSLADSLRAHDGVSAGVAIASSAHRRAIVAELNHARSAFGDAVVVPLVETILGAILDTDRHVRELP